MEFVNLYVQTEYSILSSAIRLDDYFKYAKANGLNEIAICDSDMYGAYKFYLGCIKNNLKPIIGMALNIASKNEAQDVILLYAYNYEGYINLCHLATIAHLEGFGADKYSVLAKHAKGIIAILPGSESAVLREFRKDSNNKELVDNLLFIKGIFEHFYIGLMVQNISEKEMFGGLYVLARANNIKMVALHKTCYLEKEDLEVYKVVKKISQIGNGNTQYNFNQKEENGFYLNNDLANFMYINYPDLLDASCEISNLCNLEIKKDGYHFPKYVLPDGSDIDSKEYLADLAKIGLNKRLASKKLDNEQINVYKNRLLYELDVISKMGFCDYFLIVYDYVRFAKTNNILVGPGRGSAAGSLVSYVLGITNTDPIEYNLLFERFLNPERISMPDIDVDFPDDAREKIYHYLIEKYGAKKVAHIGTFGTFKPRSAIRDVAKVMGIKDSTLKTINNYIPQYNSPSLDSIAQGVIDIKKMIMGNDDIKNLFYLASKIENMPRNISIHASGVVIGDEDLDLYTPLSRGSDGVYQTEYEASDIESIGLVKMDILSLSNLNTITKIVRDVEEKTGKKIDLYKISYNDPNVFKLMASGDTDGIFQFESSGMRKLLKELKVSSLEDMIIANAIYRPGPQDMIPTLIKRKFGQSYKGIDPSIDDILAPTYGIVIFQEQILLIAQKYAGFTLGQADLLRRAVSKKKAEELLNMREAFLKGAFNKGHMLDDANKIYDYIVKFGDYGFNRSHAAVYSIVAYQMAYLKTHYYPFFMSTLMEASLSDKDTLNNYFSSLRQRRYNILPPDINVSSTVFEVRGNDIYYPLQGVKEISAGVAKDILKIKENGIFLNYEDFVIRTKELLNKKMVISLANSGAFDSFNITRKAANEEYDNIIRMSLFSRVGDKIEDTSYSNIEYDLSTISENERNALGFNLKYDEFIKYKELAASVGATRLIDVKIGKNLVIAKVDSISEYNSKGGLMAFIKISDSSASHDVTIFASDYVNIRSSLFSDKIYLFEIMVNQKEDSLRYHLTNLKKL
ncbi:MAG: DNA polymerase III subunit alpha [Bacilli bacterium]|nr:DNA polymerase III subunit alpha [Bacilli bacterium]